MTIKQQFLAFHGTNPHVYEKVKELAYQVKNSGKTRFGMIAIFNRIRWMSAFETTGDRYKINNNFQPYYTRLLMEEEPKLQSFFQVRRSKADE